ncbi:MAG: hypothetical protein ABIR06_01745 [Cyclobacteriaceae bacterium]
MIYYYERFDKKRVFNKAVKSGKASIMTILHTADIHAQLLTHDGFFMEKGKPIYKKRGGYAKHLRAF